MLKKCLIVFMIFVCMFAVWGTNSSYAESITLSQIADKFNNCKAVKDYISYGVILTATANEDSIVLNVNTNGTNTTIEYKLNGNILSANCDSNIAMTAAIYSSLLVDSIGQLHGYSDGELLETLTSDKIGDYTLENEGIRISLGSSGDFLLDVDITKKIPLIDFSEVYANTYIEVSDLERFKDYIAGDGFVQDSKGNIVYHKTGYGNEVVIMVGEKNKLTENTYKSILSILEVMFDSKDAANYFSQNYPSGLFVNKEFSGFNVEVNPERTSGDNLVLSNLGDANNCEFVRLTIDKELVKTSMAGTANTNTGTANNNSNEVVIIEDNVNDIKEQPTSNSVFNNTNNVTNNNTVIKNTTSNNTTNNTTSKAMPYAGPETSIITSIIIMMVIVFISYIRMKKYKD